MIKKIPLILPLLALALLTNCGAKRSTLTTDEGVLINGIRWATRNVDAPGTFAASPEDAGMFYQWNRKKGWNATDEEVEGWDSSTPTGDTWEEENDPCPEGWRVPTQEELQRLVDAGSTWTTVNGINGRLFGIASNQIFLPTVGMRHSNVSTLTNVGMNGVYRSNTQNGSEGAWYLWFGSGGASVDGLNWRAVGLSIRCVKKN
jgi:uncharacterized protein (TIGR02145 family)